MKIKLFHKIAGIFFVMIAILNIISFQLTSDLIENVFINAYVKLQSNNMSKVVKNFDEFNQNNVAKIDIYKSNTPLMNLLYKQGEYTEKELYQEYYKIEEYFSRNYFVHSISDYEIIVQGMNGVVYTDCSKLLNLSPTDLYNHNATVASKNEPDKLIYLYDTYGFYSQQPSMIVTKQLKSLNSNVPFGTIYIHFDETDFKNFYIDCYDQESFMYLVNLEGMIVSSSDEELIGTFNHQLLAQAIYGDREENYFMQVEQGEQYIGLSKYIPILDMYIVNKVNVNDALDEFYLIKNNIVFLMSFVMLIGLIAFSLTIQKLTTPLMEIIDKIRFIKKDGFEKISYTSESYEVQELATAYNYMIDEINGHIEHIMYIEHQKRLAELSALQMQINPHFLYNTLATIKYLAWQGDTEKVADTIEALIDLLQNTISTTDEMVQIQQEIENLENYILINQVRYGESIHTHFFVDDRLLDAKIPKLILQPFLENAYFHAFQKKKEGNIIISIQKVGEDLHCIIEDDGDGIENNGEKKKERHFSGIGIVNVDERIKLLFGEYYGMDITSTQGYGTKVCIRLPILKNNPNFEK